MKLQGTDSRKGHSRSQRTPLQRVLGRLENVKEGDKGYSARCPAHDDEHNSLSVGTGNSGKVLIHCFAGCDYDDILDGLGLESRDLSPRRRRNGSGGRGTVAPPKGTPAEQPSAGCTTEQYAEGKQLRLSLLREWGLSDDSYYGTPAVRIPYLNPNGSEAAVRYRLARPNSGGADKPFCWRLGDSPCLYGLWRLDRSREAGYVVLVEGESDCHTLWQHDIPALGIPGVASWREDWENYLNGIPRIYVVVEPDKGGQNLLKRLARSSIRGRLQLLHLGGAKDPSGLYLADPNQFLARWRAALDGAVPWSEEAMAQTSGNGTGDETQAEHPYCVEDGRICRLRWTKEGLVVEPLANFAATVTEEVIQDDGVETTRAFVIKGTLDTGQLLLPVRVPASRFPGMQWVSENWGLKAIVRAGQVTRDYLREAIQRLSGNPPERRVFMHTGWREIDGVWVYLTASGAVGHEGYEVDLGPSCIRYALPRSPEDPVGGMRASLRLLELAPLTVTAPLWAAAYRAPLGGAWPADLTLWVEGPTGNLKSTLAALFLAHWGEFTRTTLPGSWASTANALEKLAFTLKDALVVIDDYAPSALDSRELEAKAARILRSQGNLAGRARLRADLTNRGSYPPRGLILATGEQHPSGQSLLARTLFVEWDQSEIDLGTLTACQGAADRLPHALAGYVGWLAQQMPTLREKLREAWEAIRAQATDGTGHLRVPEVLAHLGLGLDYGLAYAVEIGACTTKQAERLRASCWTALLERGRAQGHLVESARPTRRFLEVLATLVTVGRAVLLPKDSPELREREDAFIGWQDGKVLYLLPEAAFAAVARFCRDAGEPFPVYRERLMKDLAREELTACDPGRNTKTAKIGGQTRRVLYVRRDAVAALLGEQFPDLVTEVTGVTGY